MYKSQNIRFIKLLQLASVAMFLINSTKVIAETEFMPRGQPITHEELSSWDISIYPDGQGLPEGQGNATEGADLYVLHCGTCHGERGIGGSAEELSGGMQGLTGEYPDKTVGTYWPYAPTLFDFIRRAMPLYAPGTLSVDETYALVAYLLFVNDLIEEKQKITHENLAEIKMPNRDGFISDYWPVTDQAGSE